MLETIKLNGEPRVKLWAPQAEIEPEAMQQVYAVAKMDVVAPWVAVMPDVHYGKGATVGSVIPLRDALMPAATGVDIGCGMIAVPLNTNGRTIRCLDLVELRKGIEAAVPCGIGGKHQHPVETENVKWVEKTFDRIRSFLPKEMLGTAKAQMGTLGSGNHFIEVCEETEESPREPGRAWIVVHSGSRNVGLQIALRHIELAKEFCRREQIRLAHPDLAWFPRQSMEFWGYWDHVGWAQKYAQRNRLAMVDQILDFLKLYTFRAVAGTVECHHNYVAREEHFGEELFVTRKGAIHAGLGVPGIIPGSMGAKTYLVTGKGNAESFSSAPHGAGRRMSRGQAKRSFTVKDVARETEGIECRKDAGVIDELPSAYKKIETVMEYAEDLVTVRAILTQIVNVKG